jgi:hypothetical protein
MPGEQGLMWLPSHCRGDRIDIVPVFLYHVPKTGSLSLYSAMRWAAECAFRLIRWQNPQFAPPAMGRIDSDTNSPEVLGRRYALIASHVGWPFHSKFQTRFRLITVLRDPVRRVVSAYTYACMRSRSRPDSAAFPEFFRAAENRNVAVRQLTPGGEADADAAFARLERDFWMYGLSEHVGAIASAWLTCCGLPNVLMDRLNTTRPEYRIDPRPFADEIAERNAADLRLYRRVQEAPRLPPPAADPGVLNFLTTVIKEDADSATSSGGIRPLPTAAVLAFLRDGRETFGEFFRTAGG